MEGSTLRDDEVRTEVREGSMWAKDEVEDTDSSDTGDTGSDDSDSTDMDDGDSDPDADTTDAG